MRPPDTTGPREPADPIDPIHPADHDPSTARRLRVLVAGLYLFGAAGLLAELWLLAHTESFVQWLPFGVVGPGAGAVAWALVRPGRWALGAVRVTSGAVAVVGALGVWYHYRGNELFELEMAPGSGGWTLVWDSLTGATPALAPGLMIQLGLLGLAFTYRHPAAGGDRHVTERTGDGR